MDRRMEIGLEASRRLVRDGLNKRREEKALQGFETEMLRRINEEAERSCGTLRKL